MLCHRSVVLFLLAAQSLDLTAAFSVGTPSFGIFSAQKRSCFPFFSEVNDVAEETVEVPAAEEPAAEIAEAAEPEAAAAEEPKKVPERERFTMFVGNLPFQTTDAEVRDMFAQFGSVELVSVPRNRETGQPRGFAFVDMASKEEIAAAIGGLDGTMFEGRTIRVQESLPKDQIKKGPPVAQEGVKKIYVGNIPFDTDKQELIDFYAQYGTVKDLYIPMDMSTGQQRGFAFVTMAEEDGDAAIEATNGAEYMGRTLAVSVPLPRGEKAPPRGEPRTKLYVGNLSFYTPLDTVQELFEEFGEIIDCYMPEDRETGGSRGFAFVTMSPEDAARAIDETDGYELDGRIIRVNEAQPKDARRDEF